MNALPYLISCLLQIPPADPIDTYSRFPTEAQCEAAHALSLAWSEGIRKQATALGYYGSNDPDALGVCRNGWIGGGEDARRMRDELAECEWRERAWYALSFVRWPKSTPDQREQWSGVLREQIVGRLERARGVLGDFEAEGFGVRHRSGPLGAAPRGRPATAGISRR